MGSAASRVGHLLRLLRPLGRQCGVAVPVGEGEVAPRGPRRRRAVAHEEQVEGARRWGERLLAVLEVLGHRVTVGSGTR